MQSNRMDAGDTQRKRGEGDERQRREQHDSKEGLVIACSAHLISMMNLRTLSLFGSLSQCLDPFSRYSFTLHILLFVLRSRPPLRRLESSRRILRRRVALRPRFSLLVSRADRCWCARSSCRAIGTQCRLPCGGEQGHRLRRSADEAHWSGGRRGGGGRWNGGDGMRHIERRVGIGLW